ncbi:unnamed protein product [Cyprideis torosa]|uniref:Uncharacterized protein n=1 Tax=Cyprideis torosa TaxID=163714 RepID=A0A7R8W414_9CRUS|nr:unnamed protein product [Cyprideis torosa]CAG0881451.1 unnamed protein product [Cyprideis torosa]
MSATAVGDVGVGDVGDVPDVHCEPSLTGNGCALMPSGSKLQRVSVLLSSCRSRMALPVGDGTRLDCEVRASGVVVRARDLAQHGNVQDAFVIAVESQAKERLERLSALKKIKPVDMTALSHQLSAKQQEHSGGGGSVDGSSSFQHQAEINGFIEANPVYNISVPDLQSSQTSLNKLVANAAPDKKPSPLSPKPSPRRGVGVVNGEVEVHSEPPSSGPLVVANVVNRPPSLAVGTSAPSTTITSSGPHSSSKTHKPSKEVLLKNQHLTGLAEIEMRTAPMNGTLGIQAGDSGRYSSGRSSIAGSDIISSTVEFDERHHREMAVDVPEGFMARTKTPPRYPPPSRAGDSGAKHRRRGGAANGSVSSTTGIPPHPLPHPKNSPRRPSQEERIRKYEISEVIFDRFCLSNNVMNSRWCIPPKEMSNNRCIPPKEMSNNRCIPPKEMSNNRCIPPKEMSSNNRCRQGLGVNSCSQSAAAAVASECDGPFDCRERCTPPVSLPPPLLSPLDSCQKLKKSPEDVVVAPFSVGSCEWEWAPSENPVELEWRWPKAEAIIMSQRTDFKFSKAVRCSSMLLIPIVPPCPPPDHPTRSSALSLAEAAIGGSILSTARVVYRPKYETSYCEEAMRRREAKAKREQEEEWLRNSLRSSNKLRALAKQEQRRSREGDVGHAMNSADNPAYEEDHVHAASERTASNGYDGVIVHSIAPGVEEDVREQSSWLPHSSHDGTLSVGMECGEPHEAQEAVSMSEVEETTLDDVVNF